MGFSSLIVFFALFRNAAAFDPPKDPCSLLTTAEVAAALGLKVSPGKRLVPALCEWKAAGQGSSAGVSKKLTVGFLSASTWEETKALRERMKGIARTPIAGLGEEAVFAATPVANTLQVKKGTAVLDVHLYGFTPEESKTKEIALARSALGRF
jgi:hypothetical protein